MILEDVIHVPAAFALEIAPGKVISKKAHADLTVFLCGHCDKTHMGVSFGEATHILLYLDPTQAEELARQLIDPEPTPA